VNANLSPVAVVTATVIGPVLANVANSMWMYGRHMPDIAPRLGCVDQAQARELLRLGGLFFVLTIVVTLGDSADNLIIVHTLGLQSVTAFAVPAKLFMQLGLLVGLVNMPLWPAHGEALARGDVTWVRRTARRMTVISMLAALLPCAVLVLFGDQLFSLWLPAPLGGNRWLVGGLALWWVMLATVSPLFMVQNGAGVVRPQLLGHSLYLVVSVVAKWYGTKWFGIAVIPYAGVVGYAFTVLPTALYGYRRTLAIHGVDNPRRRDASW
jgi:O-antigen/teichoic acid export membrane protein